MVIFPRAFPSAALLSLGLLGLPPARAQSIRWDPPAGTLAVGQTTALQLVCENCEPKDAPVPPKVDGLTLSFAGQSSKMAFENGVYSHSVIYGYAALLVRRQAIEIPSFTIETDKGAMRVPAARFEPGGATVGSGGLALESAANSRLEAEPSSVWAGEVFGLAYSIQAGRDYYPDFGHGMFDWNPDPLVVEDWSQPEPFEARTGSELQTGLVRHSRAVASKPGRFQLNPVNQLVNLSVGVSGFGFFQQRQYQQFSVTSAAPAIDVRPLPPAPDGFKGAVGQFKLISKVVPVRASIGDPVTWTLELGGTGNWPEIFSLPARQLSKDFQVIQPRAKRIPSPGRLFDAKLTEDIVLVPTRAGTYELPAVSFVFFNPRTGAYETTMAAAATVTVTAPEGAASGAGPQEAAGGGAPAAQGAPSAPLPPFGIPRDPLPDSGTAAAPVGAGVFAGLLAAPFAALLGCWLALARQRAQQTDPLRPRREARARIAGTVARIRGEAGSQPAELPALLLAWQRDSAVLWGIAHAAPPADAIADPAWASLWAEADRALYGPQAPLPADWADRASAALAKKTVPAFSAGRLFLPRNLAPFLFLLAAIGAPAICARANPSSDYRGGAFAAAERGWRDAAAREPAAWSARHNLSLALAQQDRWEEAAAQAAAAFVQNPSSEAVGWQLNLACEKAGFTPGPLAEFFPPNLLARFARLASPPSWQLALVCAAWLAAAALAGLIGVGYGRIPRLRAAAIGLLAAALAIGLASGLAWRAYGIAADARAAIVWRSGTLRSIPTEADTTQKTAPLPAGSMARVDREFLGWVRLDFENGQTGWVRREEIVRLWR